MPARGWKFILGGAVPAMATALRRYPVWLSECLAAVGLAAVVVAVVSFDAETLYPYYWATLPAVGATLIIVAGLLQPRNTVARVLSASSPILCTSGIGR